MHNHIAEIEHEPAFTGLSFDASFFLVILFERIPATPFARASSIRSLVPLQMTK